MNINELKERIEKIVEDVISLIERDIENRKNP